jgi:hypothetical protein
MPLFRFDTVAVSINAKPEAVWQFVSELNNWKKFSDFGKNLEKVSVKLPLFRTPCLFPA